MEPFGDQSPQLRRRSAAFALVELLVVIGIIGILIAMILPALHKARQSAITLACASQLRQMGQGIYNYAASNHGLTPAWSMTHNWPNDPFTDDPNGPGWIVLLTRYTGAQPDSVLYTCPAAPLGDDRRVTYFMAGRWLGKQEPLRTSIQLSTIRTSSEFLLVGECTTPIFYPAPFGSTSYGPDDIDKDDSVWWCLLFAGTPGGYNFHHAGNNILFADGHVAPVKKWDPGVLTYSPLAAGVNWDEVQQ